MKAPRTMGDVGVVDSRAKGAAKGAKNRLISWNETKKAQKNRAKPRLSRSMGLLGAEKSGPREERRSSSARSRRKENHY